MKRFVLAALLASAASAFAAVTPNGAFATSVPIELPPYHGISPALSLQYDSQAGNGALGIGWSLSGQSQIRRASVTGGLPSGTPADRFRLDGIELIPCAGADPAGPVFASPSCKYALPAPLVAYTSRIESFRRIAFEPSATSTPNNTGQWLVWERDGTRKRYEESPATGIWLLSEVRDVHGNQVDYRYTRTGLAPNVDYLSEILYNQTVVTLYWEQRLDVIGFAARGGKGWMTQRLHSIDVQVEGQRARAYALGYAPAAISQRSSLVKVTQYARSATLDASGTPSGASLPAVVLGYANPRATQSWQTRRSALVALPAPATPTLRDQFPFASQVVNLGVDAGYLVGDFDGDGRSDTLVHTMIEDSSVAGGFFTQMGTLTARLELHARLATQASVSTQLPLRVAGHWIPTEPPQDGREKLVRLWVADANGDGMDDLIALSWRAFDTANPYGAIVMTLNVALSNGQGGFEWAQPDFSDTPWISNVVWGQRNLFPEDSPLCTPGDFNGDGRADFACTFQNSGGKHFLGVAYASTAGALNAGATAEEIADDPGVAVPGTSGFVPYETRRIAAGDIDGDGLTDLIVLDLNPADVQACADLGDPTVNRPTCSIRYDVLTLVSRGDGFERERTPTPWKREDFLHTVPGHIAAADLNGDGRADMAFFAGPVKGERFQRLRMVRTAIRRNGGYALSEVAVPQALANTELHFSLGDANGDGRTDLLVATPIGPGTAGVNCSASAFKRAVLTVVPTDKDGAFSFPQRWDDCAVSREVTDAWAEWSPADLPMLQVGDTNGDGYADFVVPVVRKGLAGQIIFIVHDRVAQPGPQAARRWIAADLNADGRSDFIAFVPETNSTSVLSLIAQPGGGYRSSSFPLGTFANPSLRSWHVMDADGDGRPDLVHAACLPTSHGAGCTLEVQTFLSRGDGSFTREAVVSVPAVANVRGNSPLDLIALDIDRDGRVDLVQPLTLRDPTTGSTSVAVRTLRSLGRSWQAANVTPLMAAAPGQYTGRAAWKAGDFDGDGRGDLLHIASGRNDARLTRLTFNGMVWQASASTVTHPPAAGGWLAWRGATSPLAWRAADVNGDGVTDLVRALRSNTNTNTSALVHALESLASAGWLSSLNPITTAVPIEGLGGSRWQLLDTNGDGAADWLHLDDTLPNNLIAYVLPGGGAGFGAVLQTTVDNASRRFVPRAAQQWGDLEADGRNVLMGIEVPTSANTTGVRVQSLALPLAREAITQLDAGARTEVAYKRAVSDSGSADCALPAGLQLGVVAELRVLDGRTADRDVTRFAYGCAAWSHTHRTLLGWRNTSSTRAMADHRPGSVELAQYSISDECLRRDQAHGTQSTGGRWVGPRSITSYLPSGDAPYRCLVNSVQHVLHGEANDTVAVNRTQSFRYDEFGNVTADVEDGLGNGLARATLRIFKRAAVPYVVDKPASEQLHAALDSSGALLRAKMFCYDGDTSFTCDGTPTKGLLTTRIDLWEQGTRLTKFQYDTVGNLASAMDANNHGTAFFYDAAQRVYPTNVVNALGQTTATLEWDRVLGKTLSITGQNNDVKRHSFDGFGRWTGTDGPDGGSLVRRYENWGDPAEQFITDETSTTWERHYVDGLGRVYRRERKSERGGTEVLGQRIVYVDASTLPARISAFSRWRQPGPFRARAYVDYRYDEAGRNVRTRFADGKAVGVRLNASGNRFISTITDEAGWITQQVHDAFGRHVETRGFDGAATLATRFEHDMADQLIAMTDPIGNATRYTWDRLGRNTVVDDPNLGRRSSGFDKGDNLTSITDARNRSTQLFYDAANRLVRKLYPSNAEVTWRYDEPGAANGRGRLTSFTDLTQAGCGATPSAQFDYTAGGRFAKVARCIRGSKASLSYGYQPDGPLQWMQYPDGERVTYHYDGAGQLEGVGTWLTVAERNADGLPTRMSLGNGVTRRLEYDLNRNWLRSHKDMRGSANVFDVAYDYRPNGKTLGTRSASNGWNLVVGADTVGRLKSVTGSHTQSWAYDLAGNMVSNSAVGIYTYTAPGPAARQPHAAQAAGSTQLRYDDNGLLSMATNAAGQMRSIDWNFDHLPAMVTDFNGDRTDYEYDAFGNLAVEAKTNETVLHFGDFLRQSSVSGAVQLMLVDGHPFAEKAATGQRRWYHLDRGDALRAVSDERGNVVARSNYGPYGVPINVGSSSAPVPRRQAGATLFGGTNLQLLGARLYDPALGRFLGPDSIVADPQHPQAANRYAYAYNSPLDFVDPSGHQPADIGIGTTVGSGGPGSFDAGFHSFSALPSSAMVASNSPTFLPPPVQQSVSTTASSSSSSTPGNANVPGIFKIDWNDPAQLQKYLTLRDYARTNVLCRRCHAYTPDMSLELLTGDALRNQKLMVAGAGAGTLAVFAAPVMAEIAGSEALLSGSIWLYMRSPVAWNMLLGLGYGLAGITVSPVPRLTPGDSRTMVRELGQVISSVQVPYREQAVRGMLQQIAKANDGWQFTEQAFQGGTVFIGNRLPTPAIWVGPTGQVVYGAGSFTAGEGAFQFVWTGVQRVLAP